MYTTQPVWQPAVTCKKTSNRLSNRLSNGFDNRFDNRVERTAVLNEQLFVQPVVKTVVQPLWQSAVYTIQPVVKPDWQPVWQQVVSCKRGLNLLNLPFLHSTGVWGTAVSPHRGKWIFHLKVCVYFAFSLLLTVRFSYYSSSGPSIYPRSLLF